MRILIDDGMQIQVGTGIGNYSMFLYNELNKRDEIDIDLSEFNSTKKRKILKRLQYLLYINSIKFFCNLGKYDVVHFTNYMLPILKNKKTKYVVTIHDMASFLYPQSVPFIYGLYNRYAIRQAIKKADVILTVSQSVKSEIVKAWPKHKDKIHVAYPGFYYRKNTIEEKKEYDNKILRGIGGRFFLFVGTIEKRKNLKIVILAFSKIKKLYPDIKLVLAGRMGFGCDEYINLIHSLHLDEDIIISGYISDNDIIRLYYNALAYIFPTVYEGFGSTQLECMSYHTPIILSDIPTNREVSSGYGMFFELNNINSLVDKMKFMISNQYEYNKKNQLADCIIKKYSWDRVVLDYINAYGL